MSGREGGACAAIKSSATLLCIVLLLSAHVFAQSQVTWKFAGPSGSMGRIIALAVDPRSSSVIYAAASGSGVWKTEDAGVTWVSVFDSQPSLQVCSLALDPLFPDVIYAGTGDDQSPRRAQGVTRSADGGRTWTPLVRMTNRPVCALAVDPTNSARVFAGSEEGLSSSTDFGVTWTKVLASPITSLAFDGPGVMYAGMLGDDSPGLRQHILTRSSDGGRTWTDLFLPRNPTMPAAATDWVSVTTNAGQVFVAVSYQARPLSQLDFYASNDGGSYWSATYGIRQATPPMAVLMDSKGRLDLAGATLLTSGEAGATWTVIATQTGNFHAAAFAGGTLLLAGEKGFEFVGVVSDVATIPAAQIVGVSIDPASHVWAGGPSGLFEIFPWTTLTGPGTPGVGGVGRVAAVQAANSQTNIFAAGANQVYDSTNS